MSSINQEIDAAVPQQKARAAKFNETKTMDGMTAPRLVGLACLNLRSAHRNLPTFDVDAARRDLLDAMNLCALALSVLGAERSTP